MYILLLFNNVAYIGKIKYREFDNVRIGCNFVINDYQYTKANSDQFISVINNNNSLSIYYIIFIFIAGVDNRYYETYDFLLTSTTSYDQWTFTMEGEHALALKIDNDPFIIETNCQKDIIFTVKKRLFKGTHHMKFYHYRTDYTGDMLLRFYYSNSYQSKTLLQGDFIYPDIVPYNINYPSQSYSKYVETDFSFKPTNYYVDPIYTISPDLPHGITINKNTGLISGVPTGYTDPIEYTVKVQSYFTAVTTKISIEVLRTLPTMMIKKYFILESTKTEFVYDESVYTNPIVQDFTNDYIFEFPSDNQGSNGYPTDMNKPLGIHIEGVFHVPEYGQWSIPITVYIIIYYFRPIVLFQ